MEAVDVMNRFAEVESLQELDMGDWSGWIDRLGAGASLSREEFEYLLRLGDFFWQYKGEPSPERPHALLASGRHSDLYINVGQALKDHIGFRMLCARAVMEAVRGNLSQGSSRYCVIGTATSATDLAVALAWLMGLHGYAARSIPLEKVPLDDRTSTQRWIEGQVIEEGEQVLHIEELVTTAGSAFKLRNAVQYAHSIAIPFVPVLPVLVDRSNPQVKEVDSSTVVPVFRYDNVGVWELDGCPYCQAGSEAVRPKDNWAELTGNE